MNSRRAVEAPRRRGTLAPALLAALAFLATACGTTVDTRANGTGDAGPVVDAGLGAPPGTSGAQGALPAGELGPSSPGSTSVPGVARGGQSPGGGLGSGQAPGTGQPPGSASRPKGTAAAATTKDPLQIGVLVTDTDSFKASSGSGESFTAFTRDATHAYIKAINAAGGVAGRQLEVVDATFNYTSANYDSEFQAACEKFTQDNRVGAVIYDGITYNQNFNTCLTRAGVPVFYMGQNGTQVGDSTDLASFPGLITAGSVSIDRRLSAILNGALARGYIRSGSKLGVIVETCPYHVRAYDRTVTPIVARNKITAYRTDVDCGAGSADHGTGIGAVQAAVLRFKGEGVDTVIFVTNYENGTVFYFAASAEAQQYRPQYLVWHNQGCPACIAFWKDQGFTAQLEKMRGFGSTPLFDVTNPPPPPPAQAAARKACLATVHRQGIATPQQTHVAIALDTCDGVNLLRQALTLSGGVGGTRAVVTAVERMGTDFVSTMTLTGATRFAPGQRDGAAMGAVSVYQAKCQCIAYVTAPSPIP